VVLFALLLPLVGPSTPANAQLDYVGQPWMARIGVIGDSLTSSSLDWAHAALSAMWWRHHIVGKAGFTVEDMRGDIREVAQDRPEAMVIALGTNDSIKLEFGTSTWPFVQTQIRGALNDVQSAGVECVVWVGVNENSGRPGPDAWAKQFNDEVRSELVTRGLGSMVDWTAIAAGHPDYFTDLVHMTDEGKRVFWAYIGDRTRDCSNNPRGSFDTASGGIGLRVSGWTFDPDTMVSPNFVHVYVDGTFAMALRADGYRPDVAAAFPYASTRHGFDAALQVRGGSHEVCVYAINNGPYGFTNPTLGCKRVTVDGSPQGFLDVATGGAASARLRGWTIDSDTTGPIDVHLYVDGVFHSVATADRARSDLAAAFPAYGGSHSFDETVGLSRGVHQVCVYGINRESTPGSNRLLGCRAVTISLGADPFGAVDSVTSVPAGLRVQGWTIDADTTAPITAEVRIDGAAVIALPANVSRPDVGAAYPGFGSNHGFDVVIAAPGPGAHEVCVYGLNAPSTPGADRLLRCYDVVVPAATATS
jgi:hypothetical protein